jgi:hypothetical protein
VPAVTALHHRAAEYGADVVGTDDIGTASTDDMFAFSEIVSAGGNPMAVAEQIERSVKKPKAASPLNDDAAMAAFSEFISTDQTPEAPADPALAAAAAAKKAEAVQAAAELKDLQGNDATAAFAGLVDSQAIEA